MAFSSYTGSKSGNCDLCKQVEKKLGHDYISEPLRNELIQVNGELKEATIQYFQNQIIVDCVRKFLDQRVTRKKTNKEQCVLSDPFYLTYVKKCSSSNSVQAFGISEDFIDRTIKRRQNQKSQVEKEELNKFVEDEINSFCIKISEYAGYGQRYKNNQQRAFQEAVKDLTSQCDNLADSEYKLESEEKEMNDLLSNYFQNLNEGVFMLKSLVSLYQEALNFQSSLSELYDSRHSTLACKINRFEYRILAATYNQKSVQALSKIKEELDQKKAITDNKLNAANSELETYAVLGPEYEKLVEEYSELMQKILHQKWTIESLKERQSFGSPLLNKEELVKNFETDKKTGSSRLVDISFCATPDEASSPSMLVETADNSTLVETAYDSRFYETPNNSTLIGTADNSVLDEVFYDSKIGETSKIDITSEYSKLVETADSSKLTGNSEIDETTDNSELNETVDNSELDETADNSEFCKETDNSKIDETADNSKVDKTDDNLILL